MKTLYQLISKTLNKLPFENSVIVLKGFNKWLPEISGNFLFGKEVEFTEKEHDGMELFKKLSEGSNNLLLLYEDLVTLADMSLAGVLSSSGREVVVLDNDFFDVYYPSNIDIEEFAEKKAAHDDEDDTYIQKIYGDIERYDDEVFIAYNDAPEAYDRVQMKRVGISTLIQEPLVDDDNEMIISLPDEMDAVTLAAKTLEIVEQGAGKVDVLAGSLESDERIKNLADKLKKVGIKVITRSYKVDKPEPKPDLYNEYLEILKRKNPNYGFRNLKIYKNPYESNELIKVEQSVIIDDIVQNAILAMENQPFRDVFVTAPTGAGKSVMFQIPAIYLAEKYDLVTLVISPLIGLMNDQVKNIEALTNLAATINSDYTPMQKEDTLNDLKNGDKSILYLSPEALLSNTDITSLIGERRIGLIVVDEAHIVATWGRSFRPDYWYLGEFINRLRNNSKQEYRFPIATFTATSTFGGEDNMYYDIIESLKMTPNKYIGNVRRDDIGFDIRLQEKDHDYQNEKLSQAVKSVDELAANNDKVLVYTPYTSHVNDIYYKLECRDKAGRYYGSLPAGEKQETLEAIVKGENNVVVATKAFGMGIDVDDIKYVYHFAPTGNIADYVQEIGRAARLPEMNGVAVTDFYKEDFRYINQLYGMSSIKNYQVKMVLRKIDQVYRDEGKRNFLVSPDDFSFIFADAKPEDVDARLKTTLLMIRKDFEADPNSTYPPLIFKPRSMFTLGYFMVNDEKVPELQQRGYMRYFRKTDVARHFFEPSNSFYGSEVEVTIPGDVYCLDYKSLWEDHYRDMLFSMFKHCFFMNELKGFNFEVGTKLKSVIIIEVDAGEKSLQDVQKSLNNFLDAMLKVLDDLRQSNKYFTTNEFASILIAKGIVKKKYMAAMIANSFLMMLAKIQTSENQLIKENFFARNSQTDSMIIKNRSYERKIYHLEKTIRKLIFGDRHKFRQTASPSNELYVIILQLIEILELASCGITSGERPEFFIRVNNAYAIEKVIDNTNYVSRTVANVGRKHRESCILMQHFFTKLANDQERWDFIERFFLGQITKGEIDQMDGAKVKEKKIEAEGV